MFSWSLIGQFRQSDALIGQLRDSSATTGVSGVGISFIRYIPPAVPTFVLTLNSTYLNMEVPFLFENCQLHQLLCFLLKGFIFFLLICMYKSLMILMQSF